MTIKDKKLNQAGHAGILPKWIYLDTDDSIGVVTAPGYLNGLASQNADLSDKDMALVTTKTTPSATASQVSVLEVAKSGANWSLEKPVDSATSYQKFICINEVLLETSGSWLTVREGQGDYVSRKSPADDTSTLGIDLTPAITTAIDKGLKLTSIDVIYKIGVEALDAHTVVLDRVEYANNVAVSVNAIGLTGSLATAVQANPYVTNIAVTNPIFNNVAASKYIVELTVDAAATTAYDFNGLVMHFDKNIG